MMNDFFLKFRRNLAHAFAERSLMTTLQIITSLLVIRHLPSSEYGVLGITSGYLSLVSFINVTPENIILRDYNRIATQLKFHIYAYKLINFFKCLVLFFFLSITSFLLSKGYSSNLFYFAVISIGSQQIGEAFTSVYSIVLSVQFRQGLVLKVKSFRALITLLITAFFPYFPSLKFIMFRDLFISVLMIIIWKYIGQAHLPTTSNGVTRSSILRILRRSLVSYSFWTHINTVACNIYYKMDTVVLSFFAPLQAVGIYSIVLNLVNFFGDFFSQMLNYQCAIAISRSDGFFSEWLVGFFSRLLLVTMTVCGLVVIVVGEPICRFLTQGNAVDARHAYTYLIPIFFGVFFSRFVLAPATTWLCLKQSVVRYSVQVSLPMLFLSVPIFTVMAWVFGVNGVAWAKLVMGLTTAGIVWHMTKQGGLFIRHSPLLLFQDFRKIRQQVSV